MWTVLMICFIMLKNWNFEVIVLACALTTFFAIGSGRMMNVVVHETLNDALCGRSGEMRKGISMTVWSHNLSVIGTKGRMMNKIQIRNTIMIVSGVRKHFISKIFEKQLHWIELSICTIFVKIFPKFSCNMSKMKP